MRGAVDAEGARQSARAGEEVVVAHSATPTTHLIEPLNRLKRAEQHKAGSGLAFDQDVKQPVDSVVHIHIGIARTVGRDESPGTGSGPRVASRIIEREISLRFHNTSDAAAPDELATDETLGTSHGLAFEE